MKRTFLFGFLGICLFLLSSCGSKTDEISLQVVGDHCECVGDLSQYLKLSEGTYTLKKEKGNKRLGGDVMSAISLTISFDVISQAEISDPEIILSIVDENFNQINTHSILKFNSWSGTASSSIISAIKNGNGKFSVSISSDDAGAGDPITDEEWEEIKEKAKYIIVSSSSISQETNVSETAVPDSSSDYSNDETSSNSNWDQALDEYEEFVDQYTALLIRSKNGDASALSEYPEILEKAQSIANRLAGSKDQMSSEQIERLSQIYQKMINAASE